MNEVLDFYHQQARKQLLPIPWLAKIQLKGLQDFKQYGFPKRNNEEWKYTLVDGFLRERFVNQSTQPPSKLASEAGLANVTMLTIHNGHLQEMELLWPGVIVAPLLSAIEQHADKIKPYLNQLLTTEHGFQALNTAMLQGGVFIYLSKNCRLDEPILLSHWQDQAQQAVYNRHLIIAEEGSEATIIEEYRGSEDCCYFTNTVTEIAVAPRAKLTHYKIQCESKAAYHIGQLAVQQAGASQFTNHSLSLGGKLVRSDINLRFQQEGAQCFLNGIYAPTAGQHMDHHTTIEHAVGNCISRQDYKGILSGHSRAVFDGKVIVAKGAQHTQADQQNKNLLLSAQAEIDTKPQLAIFADDVICTHGATVGQLDEEALFYLATRGIDRLEAANYLIHAFMAENLSSITAPFLAKWVGNLLNQQLG